MAKYIPAWQRVVLAALSNTPWEAMSADEQQAVRAFVTERNKDDAERAEALLQQTLPLVKPRRSIPLGVLILLWVLALAAAPLLTFAFGTKWLAPALAVCLVWEICGARAKCMRRLWEQRESGWDGAAAALKGMFYTTLRSPLAAADKVKLIVMTACLALFIVLWALPEPTPSEAKVLADKVGEVTAGKAVMTDALALLPDGLDGIELTRQAATYTAHGSDEEFLLAALMWMHIEEAGLQPSDYATGASGPAMYAALEETAPSQIDNVEEIAALALLLKHAGGHREIALTRFLQEKRLPDGVLAAFGGAMRTDHTVMELLPLCDTIAAAGHDPLAFLRAGMEGVTFTEAEGFIGAADTDAHREWLLRGVAPLVTSPDEVLALIRLAKGHGVSAAACYPEGAVLDWDLTHCDPYASYQAEKLGRRDTMLILRRTEKPEPFTTFVVPEEQESGLNGELPDDIYTHYDPDEADGAAQYTVVLDAASLDRLPPERIPETVADCDALIILDSWYECDGYVRFSRSVNVDGYWKSRQIDSPSFCVYQELAVYNASGEWLFSYRENAISSPAMLEENLSATDPLDWNPADHYIAEVDENWISVTCADFLYSLERRNWLLVP